MTDRLPFPQWMSAVSEAMMAVRDRMAMCGAYTPAIPALGQTTYALYADIDPAVAAAMIMKDAIEQQMKGQFR